MKMKFSRDLNDALIRLNQLDSAMTMVIQQSDRTGWTKDMIKVSIQSLTEEIVFIKESTVRLHTSSFEWSTDLFAW